MCKDINETFLLDRSNKISTCANENMYTFNTFSKQRHRTYIGYACCPIHLCKRYIRFIKEYCFNLIEHTAVSRQHNVYSGTSTMSGWHTSHSLNIKVSYLKGFKAALDKLFFVEGCTLFSSVYRVPCLDNLYITGMIKVSSAMYTF